MVQRLDKFLSDAGIGTRKEVKKYLAQKRIKSKGFVLSDPALKSDWEKEGVEFDNVKVRGICTVLCVMNKPSGYVTSTDDPLSPTVMDLVPEEYRLMGVVPVGRLDKDTEGVLLFTNDGDLLHTLISPKKNISKTYLAEYEGVCPENAAELFAKGVVLKDGTVCKSAVFEKISDFGFSLTITEGMYHQVKRMAAANGMHVKKLCRTEFAGIKCNDLEKGQFREIPITALKACVL